MFQSLDWLSCQSGKVSSWLDGVLHVWRCVDAEGICVEVPWFAGHGYDNNQCAEFCITSHHFIVNGVEHVLNFTEAGKPWGCADKVCVHDCMMHSTLLFSLMA